MNRSPEAMGSSPKRTKSLLDNVNLMTLPVPNFSLDMDITGKMSANLFATDSSDGDTNNNNAGSLMSRAARGVQRTVSGSAGAAAEAAAATARGVQRTVSGSAEAAAATARGVQRTVSGSAGAAAATLSRPLGGVPRVRSGGSLSTLAAMSNNLRRNTSLGSRKAAGRDLSAAAHAKADAPMNIFASDMVSVDFVLGLLRDVQADKALRRLEIEDLIIGFHRAELMPHVKGILFAEDREWVSVNFMDSMPYDRFNWWQGIKNAVMEDFEGSFNEDEHHMMTTDKVTFQANVEVSSGTDLNEFLSLLRQIRQQQGIYRVAFAGALFGYSEGSMLEALDTVVSDDNTLSEMVSVKVSFGWKVEPNWSKLLDACIRDIGELKRSRRGVRRVQSSSASLAAMRNTLRSSATSKDSPPSRASLQRNNSSKSVGRGSSPVRRTNSKSLQRNNSSRSVGRGSSPVRRTNSRSTGRTTSPLRRDDSNRSLGRRSTLKRSDSTNSVNSTDRDGPGAPTSPSKSNGRTSPLRRGDSNRSLGRRSTLKRSDSTTVGRGHVDVLTSSSSRDLHDGSFPPLRRNRTAGSIDRRELRRNNSNRSIGRDFSPRRSDAQAPTSPTKCTSPLRRNRTVGTVDRTAERRPAVITTDLTPCAPIRRNRSAGSLNNLANATKVQVRRQRRAARTKKPRAQSDPSLSLADDDDDEPLPIIKRSAKHGRSNSEPLMSFDSDDDEPEEYKTSVSTTEAPTEVEDDQDQFSDLNDTAAGDNQDDSGRSGGSALSILRKDTSEHSSKLHDSLATLSGGEITDKDRSEQEAAARRERRREKRRLKKAKEERKRKKVKEDDNESLSSSDSKFWEGVTEATKADDSTSHNHPTPQLYFDWELGKPVEVPRSRSSRSLTGGSGHVKRSKSDGNVRNALKSVGPTGDSSPRKPAKRSSKKDLTIKSSERIASPMRVRKSSSKSVSAASLMSAEEKSSRKMRSSTSSGKGGASSAARALMASVDSANRTTSKEVKVKKRRSRENPSRRSSNE